MNPEPATPARPVIDIHTHLAGLGHGGSGCFIDERKFHTLLYKLMRWKLGIYHAHKEGRLDQAYLERLDTDVGQAAERRALDAAVVFAHDRVYLENGEPAQRGQELYVPNEYAFGVCERAARRGRFLPAASVHPYRKDALDETARWLERGAAALKWLPNSQGMDPRDPRCVPIFDLLAKSGVPLIAHTGGEHTVSVIRPDLGDPEVLRPALERGVTVVMAHCGTASGIFDGNWIDTFCRLAREYPHCYGDTSAFTTPGRTRWLARFLKEEGVLEKLVHGSDYPVPPNAWWSVRRLGIPKVEALNAIWSFLERDVAIKKAWGYPDEVFTRAASVLGTRALERWGVTARQR
ncbi:MAG: amidohydrolase family protein [Planctomycetota bacterium]|nr:amidohydrolase family protein [Planctomycetota bacterium]